MRTECHAWTYTCLLIVSTSADSKIRTTCGNNYVRVCTVLAVVVVVVRLLS